MGANSGQLISYHLLVVKQIYCLHIVFSNCFQNKLSPV